MNQNNQSLDIISKKNSKTHQYLKSSRVDEINSTYDSANPINNQQDSRSETTKRNKSSITVSVGSDQKDHKSTQINNNRGQEAGILSTARPVSDNKIDDSIVDSNISSPPPNMSVDSPTQELIKQKTYFLPIKNHGASSRLGMVVYILLTVIVISGALYVIIL